MNSRPLTYIGSSATEPRSISPNDFLNRPSCIRSTPSDYLNALPSNSYQYVQRVTKLFWDIWLKDYIPTLLVRGKWRQRRDNIKIDDFVLTVDPNKNRREWKTGRVIDVYPGRDGLVRVVKIRTDEGDFKRPIRRVCVLPTQEEIND